MQLADMASKLRTAVARHSINKDQDLTYAGQAQPGYVHGVERHQQSCLGMATQLAVTWQV